MNGKKIAFFDFDGTITTKDSLLEIIKFLKGRTAYYAGILLNMHWFMAYQINLISAGLLKEKVLSYFFSGTPENVFQEQCDLFAERDLPGFIRKGAIAEMDRLRKEGFEMVIVSASAENWIRGFAKQAVPGINCHDTGSEERTDHGENGRKELPWRAKSNSHTGEMGSDGV